ncbi:MAG: hypothetical protein HOF84_11830 [Rhodospirillales bacterium]|nr:hypothetical protein [Rhodospirillales bacterium]
MDGHRIGQNSSEGVISTSADRHAYRYGFDPSNMPLRITEGFKARPTPTPISKKKNPGCFGTAGAR